MIGAEGCDGPKPVRRGRHTSPGWVPPPFCEDPFLFVECNSVGLIVAIPQVVDLTDGVVKLFKPSEQALKWIQQLKAKPPMKAEELDALPPDH